MSESDALKALGAFPIVQAAVAIVVLLAGVWLMRRGERDRKSLSEPIPQWLMMGPAHDVMTSIHGSAEQSRRQTELLQEAVEELRAARTSLELIRNESRLR